jgi:predicted CopG family antitoxin
MRRKTEMEKKHVFINKEVWKQLHELKVKWEKRSINEVIEQLIKNNQK